MKYLPIVLISLSVAAAGCGSSTPTSNSNPNQIKFTATLLPSNETPAVTNAESSGNGNVAITMNLTRDTSGAITAATADFTISLTGFPGSTGVTAAHIHPGAAGTPGAALVSLALTTGEFVLNSSGSGTFTRTGVTSNLDPARAQDIINNPSQYYFNVHSQLNSGGFARGQLVKQ